MTKYTFKPKDFKAFNVEGLDARMEALNEYIRPQLHKLGEYFNRIFLQVKLIITILVPKTC